MPLDPVLAPQLAAGAVTHRRIVDYAATAKGLRRTTCREYAAEQKQLMHYAVCLRDYGARHQWMGEHGEAPAEGLGWVHRLAGPAPT